MRHAHLLGAKDPVMHQLVPALVQQMGQAYPELVHGQALIEETLELEEKRFKTTLDRGLKLLDTELSSLSKGAPLDGATAFKLYDTFGFPLDLTQDALREKDLEVDVAGFETAMNEQKAKARAAWSGSGEAVDETIWFDIAEEHGNTEFLGYDTEIAEGQVQAIVKDGAKEDVANKGDTVSIVLNQTPFYAESGGQVGDTGVLKTETGEVTIKDVRKKAGVFVHVGSVVKGAISNGDAAELLVDHTRRTNIRANHSVTHLLHEALRGALGDHVAQRGSLNAADRMRFDFSHSKGMSEDEIRRVENEVNEYIRQNSMVETRIMTPDDARAIGAQALFGEKYGDEVRVVSMGDLAGSNKGLSGDTYSLELCGGTHVTRTGEIGLFVLTSESASSSGVRRIEGLTGQAALDYTNGQSQELASVAKILKAQPSELGNRISALLDERKSLQNEVATLRRTVAMGTAEPSDSVEEIAGVPFFSQVLSDVPGKDLRGLIDEHKSRLGSAAILLISDAGGKVAVAAGVTDDLTDKVSAVDLVKTAAVLVGGKGGGGRPDMAQAGGSDASNAPAAVDAVKEFLKG
jgi:alanyl-tRNA synthetase